MKFKDALASDVLTHGGVQENKVGIDMANADFIVQILSTNLYRDPLGSFLRETISNAWDSHVEAGNTDPVLCEIKQDTEGEWYCRITDFGVGISPERFDEIYRNIGSSTKRDTNNMIGGFGIGRFSAIAYSGSAVITSVYNGTKTIYRMYKNGNSLSIDTLASVPAPGDRNGVSVQVPIKKTDMGYVPLYQRSTYMQDQDKMYSYLCNNMQFFENLVVDAPELKHNLGRWDEISYSDITVKKYTDAGFSLSSLETPPSILIGNVLYPMPSSIIVNNMIAKLNIAVQLNIGEVQVTPNREEIVESPDTITLIQSKVDDIYKYMKDLKTKKLTPLREDEINMGRLMSQVVSFYVNSPGRNSTFKPDTRGVIKDRPLDFNLQEIELHTNNTLKLDIRDLEIKFKCGEKASIRDIIYYVEDKWDARTFEHAESLNSFWLYTVNAGGAFQGERNSSLSYNRNQLYRYLADYDSSYIIAEKDNLTALQKAYVRHLLKQSPNKRMLSNTAYVAIKKSLRSEIKSKSTPAVVFKPEPGWKSVIYRLLTDIDTYLIDAVHIRDIKIPKDFVDQYEAAKKAKRNTTSGIKRAGKISYRKLIPGNGDWKTSKDARTDDYKDFVAYRGYWVYIRSSEGALLNQMRRVYSCVNSSLRERQDHKFIEVANATADKFEKSPEVRAVHFSEYLKQAHSYMKQLVTMAVLERITTELRLLENQGNSTLELTVRDRPDWTFNRDSAILFPNVTKISEWYTKNLDKIGGTYHGYAFQVLTGNPFRGTKDFEELAQTYIKHGLMDPIWYVYTNNVKEFAAYAKLRKQSTNLVDKPALCWQLIVKNKLFIPTAEANLKFQNKKLKLKTITENEYYNTLCKPESNSNNA